MKEKLLKYGIPYQTLTVGQLDSLDEYIKSIKNERLESFYEFAKNFGQAVSNKEQELEALYQKSFSIVNKALKLAESVLPNSNQSLLLSFGKTTAQSDFEPKHIELLVKLSALSGEINTAFKICEEAMSSNIHTYLTELILRYAALAEFSQNAEIIELYNGLYISREKLSVASHQKKAEEYSKLIFLLDTVTKKLCYDADTAYQASKDNNTPITNYHKILRQYISLLHQISLQLNELQGGKNVKI